MITLNCWGLKMDKKYVDVNQLDFVKRLLSFDKIFKKQTHEERFIIVNIKNYIIKTLWLLNPADVQEVRHGKWVKEKKGVLVSWHCSACNECYYLDEPKDAYYCPRCGAEMDGGNNGTKEIN